MNNADVISMPDSWEYPWFAAWDLAFHAVTFALIDPAFAKAQLGAGTVLPDRGTVFVSVKDGDKPLALRAARLLADHGFRILATAGTAAFLEAQGCPAERINKVAQGRPHIVDRLVDGGVDLIVNTTEGWQSLQDSQPIRSEALARRIPYFTTASAALQAANAIASGALHKLEVRPLQSYHSRSLN